MPTRRLWTMLIVSALVLVVGRIVLVGPERCPPPSAAEARAAAAAAAGWLADNQRPDGTYTYAVDGAGRDLGDYNIVRHAGVTLSLYQAARAAADDDLLAAGDRGLAWMVDRLAESDDWVALAQGSDAPLGGSALMLAALAERREMTGDTTYDDTMRGLGRFLASLQKENGDFYTRTNVSTGEPDRVGISPYFAGEALWAIARLQNALPDPLFRTTAEQAARFISTERNDLDFVPVAPLNDHWGSYGFAEMADWPLGDAEADYARSVYGRFQLLIRWEAHQGRRRAVLVDARTRTPRRRAGHMGRRPRRPGPPRARRRPARRSGRPHPRQHAVWCRGARRTSARLRRRRDRRRVVHRQRDSHGRPAARDLGPARPRIPARGHTE